MTAAQLRKAAQRLFGDERGWQSKLAAALKVDRATASRWLSGESEIPGPVEAAVTCWLKSGVPN